MSVRNRLLSYSHLKSISQIDNLTKRAFYELEAIRGCWSFRELERQILTDEDYFFADLVFYHRILKCHVIVELKIDKFHHEYASQLNLYLNYFKAEVIDDNPPIGILLCTEKEMKQTYCKFLTYLSNRDTHLGEYI